MKKAEILAEIDKVKSNKFFKFLPESVKQIKLKQLNAQFVKASGGEVKGSNKPEKKVNTKETTLSKIDWEREVIDLFAENNEMSNSDAQGVFDAQQSNMDKLYEKSVTPKSAAKQLNKLSTSKSKKSTKELKSKNRFLFKFKGKDYTELDEIECNELIAHIQERREAAKKSEKKTKSRPVIEKIATPIVRAVKTAVENIPDKDIKDKPKTELSKIDKAIAATKRLLLMELKTILGDDFDKDTVDDELKELHALSKELHKKYGESKPTDKKVVKLTAEQDKEWEKIFEISLNEGMSDSKAEKQAFKHIASIWPELKDADKIE